MGASQLADVCGLVGHLCAEKAKRGDPRDKATIADELLMGAGMPDLSFVIERLAAAASAVRLSRAD